MIRSHLYWWLVTPFVSVVVLGTGQLKSEDLERPTVLLKIDNGIAAVGIDREKGASITWLSWKDHPGNAVNIADPGRLIQQSYYAGKSLDRTKEGQHKAWSPWTWNPIQGGGVGSWAKATTFEKADEEQVLYSETIPKLWDMADEDAAATMRQWTHFEKGMPNVNSVRCEFVSRREAGDRWGEAVPRHQELPALYFTRNFNALVSYLGGGKWREESRPVGPPWGRAEPPLKAMACFNAEGQGIGIFSPAATEHWNVGPHGEGESTDPTAGPCMHIAPIATVKLGPASILRYRYWMVVGTRNQVAARLDELIRKYREEKLELVNP